MMRWTVDMSAEVVMRHLGGLLSPAKLVVRLQPLQH